MNPRNANPGTTLGYVTLRVELPHSWIMIVQHPPIFCTKDERITWLPTSSYEHRLGFLQQLLTANLYERPSAAMSAAGVDGHVSLTRAKSLEAWH